MSVKSEEKVPDDCEKCSRWKQAKERIRSFKLLEKAIEAFETRFKAPDFKPSVAEYLKLVQLEQEVEQETAKEIKVTWIDPTATSSSEK